MFLIMLIIILSNPLQSAYRKHHSTKSALLKVHNDIIRPISIDKGEVTFLILLVLSAAFDTWIDHATLTYGLSD